MAVRLEPGFDRIADGDREGYSNHNWCRSIARLRIADGDREGYSNVPNVWGDLQARIADGDREGYVPRGVSF